MKGIYLSDAEITGTGAPLDLIVRSGSIVDGSGDAAVIADVGIVGRRIAAIGDLSAANAPEEIDARGLVVAPGFVDVHSHSDFTLLADGRAQSALAQGVTTELVGNCGHGCSPIGDSPGFAANIFGYDASILPLDWRTTGEYLDRLEQGRPSINIATLIPLGNLRMAAMGDPDRQASRDELATMVRLLESGLEAGAFGMSSGLQYPDSMQAQPSELVELGRSVAARGGLQAWCWRHSDEKAVEGIVEPIETGRASGVRVQISHAMPQAGSPPDMMDRTFDLVDSARRDGVDVAFDMHTRAFGEVNLSVALPVWSLEGGREKLAWRLGDASERAKIKKHVSFVTRFLPAPGPDRMTLAGTKNRAFEGKSLAELTPPGADPLDTVLDILRDEVEDVHRPLLLIWMHPEEDLVRFVGHPQCSIGSDATTLNIDGPLANAVFYPAYTWAAWFLRRIVLERSALSLEEGIRRLTSLPAERMGVKDRGVLRPGAWADIAVFDPARITEHGTHDSPNQLASGMVHVLVNGTAAFKNSEFTGAGSGTVLRAAG